MNEEDYLDCENNKELCPGYMDVNFCPETCPYTLYLQGVLTKADLEGLDKIINEELTLKSIKELEQGKGKTFNGVKELFKDLNKTNNEENEIG